MCHRLHPLVPFALALATACADAPPPTPDAPPRWTAVDAKALSRLTIRQGLSTTEGAAFTGYTTQTFDAVSAPIATMRIECPEKVLNATEVQAFGLEAPYVTQLAVQSTDGVWEAPLGMAAPDADAQYAGAFVLLRKGDQYLSVYPHDTTGKILRPISATVTVEPSASPTTDVRRAFGSRLRGVVSQPLLVDGDTAAIKADLESVWLADPCGN